MKAPFKLILVVLACVLFFLASIGGPWSPGPPDWPWRGRLIAFGLFAWALSTIVTD